VTDNLLQRLAAQWRITVIAIAMPSPDYTVPWARIVPAQLFQDWMGRLVLRGVCQDDPPDITVAFMDPWVYEMFREGAPRDIPMVGYLPVDGYNMKAAPALASLRHAIFLSPFALREARAGGYAGSASIIGHGVDLALYHPMDRVACREVLGLPQEAVILGQVGQNQPRKRWDLAFQAFALLCEQWAMSGDRRPLLLYCHCLERDVGWDLPQLASWYGIREAVRFPSHVACAPGGAPAFATDHGSTMLTGTVQGPLYPERVMPFVYNALDVQFSTSWGEGFGLTTLEGMACGIPQVIPLHTALASWARTGAFGVEATERVVSPGGQNLVGAVPRPDAIADACFALLADPEMQARYQRKALALAQQPYFSWDSCAAQMHGLLAAEVVQHAPA
jgi:glycosyltransferase involved in cell wall biosynthesis